MKTIRIWVWACCLFCVSTAFAQVTQQVTALQFFYDTDPGVGNAGNGAIIAVTPTSNLDQTFALTLPGSLTSGFHYLYARVKDEYGRWSSSERRMFLITDIAGGTRNIVAYQCFIDNDPGVGIADAGAVVGVSSTADFNTTIGIALPSLSMGLHQLYIRAKDDKGRWSIAERRQFYITPLAAGTQDVAAYQFFFDNDPGVDVAGTGGIVSVVATPDFNSTIAIPVPTLTNGIHQLYIRAKDTAGRWSIAERRNFFVSEIAMGPRNINAYQYYFDNDPGAGVAGNGGIVPVVSTDNFNATIMIALPALSKGMHQLYVRTRDDAGRWSIAERRMFYISDVVPNTNDLVSLEYYFDNDPGVRNANAYPIATTGDFNQAIALQVPCLSTGVHYLYIRAKDTANRWSIIGRDTLTITSGIEPSVVSPAGPVSICTGSNIVLSTTPVSGVTYQWVENGNPISGETNPSLTVSTSGSYALRTICGSFVLSNTVVVTVLSTNTYYADADADGYGNAAITIADCTQPAGYVVNSTDCNDGAASIHPGAAEACNLIDDDCDGTIDEGVQITFYADADNDGYGDPTITQIACTAPSGYVANGDDCDDADIAVNPGEIETCNLIDDDCDGIVDDGVQFTFYADVDEDSYGSSTNTILACTQPVGYVTNDDDCNDGNPNVNPDASEVCNTYDDDCDGLTDDDDPSVTGQSIWYVDVDNDGYGTTASTLMACAQPPGYAPNDDDCNDADAAIHPGATEVCNTIDDDCDGLTDDADPSIVDQLTWYADADADGYGNPAMSLASCTQPSGYVENNDDCDDSNMNVNPVAIEICNTIDDDCDGLIDEGLLSTFYADADNDGFGNPSVSTMACIAPSGYVSDNTDCDDVLYYVYPGAPETCNGVDDDCDGLMDEGFDLSMPATGISTTDGLSFCLGGSTELSVTGGQLGTGADWYWYEGGCGLSTSIGTGTTLLVNPTAGLHTYYVRAQGNCNSTACVSITINVHTAPAFTTCPLDVTISTDATMCTAFKYFTVIATGIPSPSLGYAFSGATSGSGPGTGSGNVFNAGTTAVTITADNSCGTAECSFTINVVDTEDPAFTACPTAISGIAETGQWGAHVSWTEPVPADNCMVSDLSSSHAPGDFFNVGSTVVTYTAEDASGNTAMCQFYVTVTPPVLVSKVNASIFTNDISFSESNPDPGTAVNVSATIHNTSNVAAAGFDVRLTEMYSNTAYPVLHIPALGANQSTQLNWVVDMPNVDAFVPIQVSIDVNDELDESNEFDNAAVKPLICGTLSTLGTMGVGTNPVPAVSYAGTTIQLCGSAYYEDIVPPLDDPSVAGAELIITILETGETIHGYTDENGTFCYSYQTPNTPGLYHYTVEVTDNTLGGDASGTFLLTVPPEPPCNRDLAVSMDLVGITSSDHHNYTVIVGTSFSAIVHVLNDCQSVSPSTTLFISLPNGTPVPGPFVIPPLSPGQVYDVVLPSMTLNIVGHTYISATVDYYNVVAESSESNNTTFKSLNILPLLPDLAVIGGSVLSEQVCQPANTVSFVVKNYGTVPSGSFNGLFEFYGNGALQSTSSLVISNLNAGEDTLVIFPFATVFLTDSFEFTVDTPSVIAEMVESNNRLSLPYTFRPCLPDIAVLGCEYTDVSPADVMGGSSMTVTALVYNNGLLTISTPFDIEFDVAGQISTVPVPGPLAAGAVIAVSTTAIAPTSPEDFVSITADAGNAMAESNESNNGYAAPLCYDFEFEFLDCFGYPYFSGTQYYCNSGEFRIGMWNFGAYDAANLHVKFEIGGPGLSGWVLLGTTTKYAGNSCECPSGVELPNNFFFPQTGLYQVRITLDPDDDYAECNESNNEVVMGLNVVESVDYTILSPFIAPSDLNPDINEPVTFNVSYSNDGCTGFSPMELYAQVDNDPLDSLMVSALSAGGFNTVAIPTAWSSAIPGVHVFRAIVDHDEQFGESNELNNEATKAIIVGDAPDYNVVNLVSTDYTPYFGQLLTFTATLTNQGQSTGSGTLQFLYDDGVNGETLLDQHTISIMPGSTIDEELAWIASAPNSKIIARIVNVTPVEADFTDNEKDLQLNDLSLTVSVTDVQCSGIDLGSVQVAVTGGQPPYSILWSNGYSGDMIDVPAGTYSVTVTDVSGLAITVMDTVVDLALPVTWYYDGDHDGYGNPDVVQYVCVQPEDYVGTGTDCNDANVTIYPDAPEIPDAYDNDCDGLINEGINLLDVDAGDCEIAYLGYGGSACVTLSVYVSGGTTPYSYTWSNGAATQSTSVCPEQTAIYTVTVTDGNGFSAEDNVTVQVIDIRCGNNNNKVLVCHIPPGNPENIQMICIAPSAVQAHLDHGCFVGICDAPDPCEGEEDPMHHAILLEELTQHNEHGELVEVNAMDAADESITVFPNPADEQLVLQLPARDPDYAVTFINSEGKVMLVAQLLSGKSHLDTAALPEGMYHVQIQSASGVTTKMIVIMH